MPTPITIDGIVNLDFRQAQAKAAAFQKQFQSSLSQSGGLRGITTDIGSFENALGRATNRIVSLAAASVVFNILRKSFGSFAEATIDVEQSLARINVNLGQTTETLKQFGGQIFNIARATGSTFEDAAKGAEELARQGLGAEETLKRLKDALVLSRIAGIDSATAVDSLTAAINSFNREALTSTDVVNRFAAVDTKFAVSTKDLEEAVSRVGSSAAEAGVSFNELLAIVTSVQQTTARGGATIGNALKTIFTRVGRPEVLEQLQAIGVAVKDTEGNTLPAIRVLQNLATTYDGLSASQKNVVSRQVAGTFQINILKAALADLNKEQSTYNQALKTAANAGDAATKKNEQLNKTLRSSIDATKNTVTELFSSLGGQKLSGYTKGLLDLVENTRKFLSGGDTGEGIGKSLGEGMLKGIANVLSGPALLGLGKILAIGLGKVVKTIAGEATSLLGINDASAKRAEIQLRIENLVKQTTAAEYANLQAASSVLAKKEAILAISARIRQTELIGTPLQNAFLGSGPLGLGKKITIPRFAKTPGAIPNLAAGDQLFGGGSLLGYGGEGSVYGSSRRRLAFKRFHTRGAGGEAVNPAEAITNEYNLTKLAQSAGLPVLPVRGSLKRSLARGGLVKPLFDKDSFEGSALNDIDPDIGSGLASHLTDLFASKGIQARDLTSGGNIRVKGDINQFRRLANQIGPEGVLSLLKEKASVYDLGAFSRSPNFADPLYEAIRREKAAGVPEHQIYVDQDHRLVGPDNPQGLLVANKRDEPAGGHQGVDRVLAQGGNPKRAGIAPNFARKRPLLTQQEIVSQRLGIDDPRYDEVASKTEKVSKALDSFQAAIARSDEATRKNADALDIAKSAAAKFAELAKQGNPFGVTPPRGNLDNPKSVTVSKAQIQQALYGPKTFGTEAAPVQGAPERQFSGDGGQAEAFLRRSAGATQYRNPIGPSAAAFNAQQAAETEDRFRRSQTRRANVIQQGRANQAKSAAFRQNASLIASFVLPAAAGFIDEGKGGTNGGIARGAASVALQGAGLGAIFGPLGLAIGGVGGGIIGALGKLTKSVEEYNDEVDKGTMAQTQSLDAIGKFVALGNQLGEADAASPEARTRIAGQRAQALTQIDPEFRTALSKQGISTEETNRILLKAQEKKEQIENTNDIKKQVFAADSGRNSLTNRFLDKAGSDPFANIATFGLAKLNQRAFGRGSDTFESSRNGEGLRNDLFNVLKDKGGLGKDDQSFITRSLGGLGNGTPAADDVERLSKILGSLGDTTKVTADNFGDLIDGLSKGSNAFKGYKKEFDVQAKQIEEAKGRLPDNAFVGRPNLDVYGQAASIGRNPLANRGQRAQAKLNLYDELSSSGAAGFDKTTLLGDKGYQQAKAGVQSNNVADAAIAFLQGNNSNVGGLRDARGNPNNLSIQRTLDLVAQGGGANAEDAAKLSKQFAASRQTEKDKGIKTIGFVEGQSGYAPGAGYGEFAKSRRTSSLGYVTKENIGVLRGTLGPDADFVTAANVNSRKPKDRQYTLRQEEKPAPAPSTAPTQYDHPDKKRDEDIAAYLKIAADNKAAAAQTAQVAQALTDANLKIAVQIQGATGGLIGGDLALKIAQLFQGLSDVNNKVDANAGKPNPPSPPVHNSRTGR